MTITIHLSPSDEKKLLERAAQSGQEVTAYIHRLIERDLQGVDEALAPFRRQVEESGMSDDELGAFFGIFHSVEPNSLLITVLSE